MKTKTYNNLKIQQQATSSTEQNSWRKCLLLAWNQVQKLQNKLDVRCGLEEIYKNEPQLKCKIIQSDLYNDFHNKG